MKKKLNIGCSLVVLVPVLLAGYRVITVAAYLHSQDSAAREAFRASPPDKRSANAVRFLKNGRITVEPWYFIDPQKMKERGRFNIRLNPRVSKNSPDGWVGMYNGHWYVKIY